MVTTPTTPFDITPEKQASKLQCLRRQLFVTPPLITQANVNLTGKTAIITGSNGGIGLECARQLLDLGLSKLILTGRDETKNEAAIKNLSTGRTLQPGQIEVWKLDMLSYDSITTFTTRASHLSQLDIVILNAGVFRNDLQINPSTGYEEDVQTNYISTALLVLLFLRIFKTKASPSLGRIVVVSSDTAAWAQFKEKTANPLLPAFKDKSYKWDTMERYGTSKLLAQLFVVELVKRIRPELCVVNMANPGLCHGSGLGRHAGGVGGLAMHGMARIMGRTPSIGARALVDAAVGKGGESHGLYCEDGKIRP